MNSPVIQQIVDKWLVELSEKGVDQQIIDRLKVLAHHQTLHNSEELAKLIDDMENTYDENPDTGT